MTLFDTTTLSAAGTEGAGPVADAVQSRANIFKMTQAAEDAVLRPEDCGAFPHDLRAAIAARIAAHAGEPGLAGRYAPSANARADISDPAQGVGPDHAALIAFVDKAAGATKDIAAADIARLQSAGIGDADVVRLCELVAFVSYQVRVVAGLRLMSETNP